MIYMAMSLGSSFDLFNYRKGHDLIYGNLNNKAVLEEKEEYSARYKMINSAKDVREFLGVEPRLAIRTKLDTGGIVVYPLIRASIKSRETEVEIMMDSRYIRGVEKIPSSQQVLEGWKSKEPKDVGTHYLKSFSRGGYFITSIIFSCETAEKKEKVMKAVLNNLKDSGTLDESFVGKMRKIKEELGEDYVDFAFGPIHCIGCILTFPVDLKKVVNIVTTLPETVKSRGSGFGTRLLIELEELSTISDFPAYQENSKIVEKLDEVNQMFDDVMIAREELLYENEFLWLLDEDEDQKEVNELDSKLEKCRKEFLHALVNLDVSPSASLDQLDDVYKAYGSPDNNYQKYQKQFRALRDKMKKKISK